MREKTKYIKRRQNPKFGLGCIAQSVGHLTPMSEVLGSIPGLATHFRFLPVWPHTFVSPSAGSRRAVVSYWRLYVQEVLVNCLGGQSLPRSRAA